MKITSKRQYEQFRIYIDNVLHLQLKLNDLIGFQAWIHGTTEFYIEYYFSSGAKITTAYGSKDKWEKILMCLEQNVTVLG